MPRLAVNNGEIYFEEHGDGHPVVLAHGVGGNHAIWYQQVPALSARYRVITFDHRGFGNSTDAAGLGRTAFVADLEALLDHLQLERVALVGQSMGGGTCLGFAATHPHRVTALAMCDSLHGFAESPAVAEIMNRARTATAELSQLERVLGEPTRLHKPELAELYRQLNSFNKVNRKNLAGAFTNLVRPEELAATAIPVLFIVGEADVLFPADAVRQLHREVANSTFVEVAGSGHSAFFEEPAKFNSEVVSFLDRVIGQRLP